MHLAVIHYGDNAYRTHADYKEICVEESVWQGLTLYAYKFTYEKKYSLATRLGLFVLAALAYCLLIPYFLYPEKVRSWKKGAIGGTDGRPIFIFVEQPRQTKSIQFDQARAREFDENNAPDDVARLQSTQLTVFVPSRPTSPESLF